MTEKQIIKRIRYLVAFFIFVVFLWQFYISYASTIAVIFHDSPCSCSVHPCLYVCAFAYLCSTSFVVSKSIGPSLSSVFCKPTRIGAIVLQRVMVEQSSIPDEQPPGVMVWRRVIRHLSVGQLGRLVG